MSDRNRNHMDCWSGGEQCLLGDPECPMAPRKVDADDQYIHPIKLIGGLGYHVKDHGPVVITHTGDRFVIASEWGEEAPDSPMAGAAAYGAHAELYEALIQFLQQCGHL